MHTLSPWKIGSSLAAVVLLAACSGSPSSSTAATGSPAASGTSAASAPAAAGGSTLTISGFAFAALTVKPGAPVTVTNGDSVAHTVHVNGTQTDVNVPGGGQATFTAPTTPGSYPLTCDFHPSMHGTLTVSA